MSYPIPTLPPVGSTLRRLLLEQYKQAPHLTAILDSIGAECDLLHTASHELWNIYDIDTAEGAQLDLLGILANESRKERSDIAYRAVLKVLFRTQVSGTPEDVIRSVKEYTGAPTVVYIPEYPAGFWIHTPGVPGPPNVFLRRVAPAGVQAFAACFLTLTTGELFGLTTDEELMIVGPCAEANYPADNIWDGGLGTVDPDTMVFQEAWPFRDGTGIGEYPDGGLGEVDPITQTFTDGTYAEDTGG